jgi:methyl-accepting chemotaxis protein
VGELVKVLEESKNATNTGIKLIYKGLQDSAIKINSDMTGISQTLNNSMQLIYKDVQKLENTSALNRAKLGETDETVKKINKSMLDLNNNVTEKLRRNEESMRSLENKLVQRMADVESRFARYQEDSDKKNKFITNVLYGIIALLVIAIIRG